VIFLRHSMQDHFLEHSTTTLWLLILTLDAVVQKYRQKTRSTYHKCSSSPHINPVNIGLLPKWGNMRRFKGLLPF
jgi:hypothetical protein